MSTTPIYKIHPAIGIARVGNSPDSFYIAPETTGSAPIEVGTDNLPVIGSDGDEQPVKKYKDARNRIRRQAARFRVFAYDDNSPGGRELTIGATITALLASRGELITGSLSDIQWTVYVANKKASWFEFKELEGEHGYSAKHPLRNVKITSPGQRQQLIIDPGPRMVTSATPRASFDRAGVPGTPSNFPPKGLKPFDIDTLGELIGTTDKDNHNRLLVLGGLGSSGSMNSGFGEPSLQTYANNDGWFDDTSDGAVAATLVINVTAVDGNPIPSGAMSPMSIPVDSPAWVITGYPRYAPQITDIVTMDDLIYDVAVRTQNYAPAIYANGQFQPGYIVYFYRDIWPILQRPFSYGFVSDVDSMAGGDPHQTGPDSGGNFDPVPLSIPPYAGEDPQERASRAARRMLLHNVLRKAGRENSLIADPAVLGRTMRAMPLLCGDNPLSNNVPSKFLRLTDTMLFLLRQWANGNFLNEKLEDIAPPPLPPGEALDRGVLGNALGGAFCPGGEASWIMRNSKIYSSPYRIRAVPPGSNATPQPGTLTQPLVAVTQDLADFNAALLSNGLEPGDLTKYGPLPWQADFNECTSQDIDVTYDAWNTLDATSTGDTFIPRTWTTYWWPAHRPDILTSNSMTGAWSPTPGTSAGDLAMVSIWPQLGFIVPASDSTPETPDFTIQENQLGGGV